MGMDVSGKNPTTEQGVYFRASVWGWRPLWDYCAAVAPAGLISAKLHHAGHMNDGAGLDAIGALRLAQALRDQLKHGGAFKYCETLQRVRDALPDERCEWCAGTGRRLDPPGKGAGTYPCNACGGDLQADKPGKGWVRPFECSYRLDVETISEFTGFLLGCGGFEIW